jgi:hypothetical protein
MKAGGKHSSACWIWRGYVSLKCQLSALYPRRQNSSSNKMLQWCYHGNMTAKGSYASRVRESDSEGKTGTTWNRNCEWNHGFNLLIQKRCSQSMPKCATTTQQHYYTCMYAAAYGALFICVSNTMDSSLNTYCGECTNLCGVPYACVVLRACNIWQHCNTVCRSTLRHNGFAHYSCFMLYLSLLHYHFPLPWEHSPLSTIMSSWQHHHKLLLLMCKECGAIMAHPR